jgi:hypothetical protein
MTTDADPAAAPVDPEAPMLDLDALMQVIERIEAEWAEAHRADRANNRRRFSRVAYAKEPPS